MLFNSYSSTAMKFYTNNFIEYTSRRRYNIIAGYC